MDDIILLHGAVGSKSQLQPLKEKLMGEFNVHLLDFPGHGGSGIPSAGFSIEGFSKYIHSYITEKRLSPVIIFGYSMGGYAGMYLSALYPGDVKRLITLGTKYLWDESIAAEEVKMLDPKIIQQKVPQFAAELKDRHSPEDWESVLSATKQMLIRMGIHSPLQTAHFHKIKIPCLLLTGDRDKTVSIGETLAVYKQLTEAQLGVIPFSGHAIEKTDIILLSYMISRFCK